MPSLHVSRSARKQVRKEIVPLFRKPVMVSGTIGNKFYAADRSGCIYFGDTQEEANRKANEADRDYSL